MATSDRLRTLIVYLAASAALLSLAVDARACPWLDLEVAIATDEDASEPFPQDDSESEPPPQFNTVTHQSCDPNTTGSGPARWFAARTDRICRDRDGTLRLKSWQELLADALAHHSCSSIAFATIPPTVIEPIADLQVAKKNRLIVTLPIRAHAPPRD